MCQQLLGLDRYIAIVDYENTLCLGARVRPPCLGSERLARQSEAQAKRNISFEEIVHRIQSGQILNIENHPNQKKYPDQKMFIVPIDNYVYLVPFVEEDEEKYFLKTIIPSRKATKKYLKK